MKFKIDTKETYTLISLPEAPLDGEMADALLEECAGLSESGSRNFLLDLSACQSADAAGADGLSALHAECYGGNGSLAITGANAAVVRVLQQTGATDMLNLAPKMAEAIDIISMEILERDLMEGEEDAPND